MPYDYQRGLAYGGGAAALAYLGSGIVNQVAGYVPGSSDDKLRPAIIAAVTAIAVDAAYQNFRG